MANWQNTLSAVLDGRRDKSIRFGDLLKLLKRLGFHLRMGKGDHHILYFDAVEEIVNLQPLPDGKAKPYQVRQLRQILLRYKLHEYERN